VEPLHRFNTDAEFMQNGDDLLISSLDCHIENSTSRAAARINPMLQEKTHHLRLPTRDGIVQGPIIESREIHVDQLGTEPEHMAQSTDVALACTFLQGFSR
jgi:hypothetical protein